MVIDSPFKAGWWWQEGGGMLRILYVIR